MATKAEAKILQAAEKLFRTRGYPAVTLADIATEAGIPIPALQSHYANPRALLFALLDQHSPYEALETALEGIRSDTAEGMIREGVGRLIHVFFEHLPFAHLAIIDLQVNNGAYTTELFNNLASLMIGYVNRLSNMPDVRPISSIMLGRVLASLLVGFVVTQQLAPEQAQLSMRIFPQQAWIDGITDIFLRGILEEQKT